MSEDTGFETLSSVPQGPRCEPAVSWEQRAGLGQWCSPAPARGPQPSPRHQPLPLRGRSERVTSETTHLILTKAFEEGSPQLPSTCSALKRVWCPSDSPAPSRALLTTGYPQLLWAGTTLDRLNPASLCTLVTPCLSVGSQFPCSEWPSGSSKRGGEESLSPLSAVHAVPSAWGMPSPQPRWAPGGPSPLAAAPAELRAGCLVQGNLGCLHLSPNACFHSGPLARVHRGAGCPPLPLENQRIQLEGFSGVLPHPRPH